MSAIKELNAKYKEKTGKESPPVDSAYIEFILSHAYDEGRSDGYEIGFAEAQRLITGDYD